MSTAVAPSTRRIALAVVIVAQAAMFAIWLPRPLHVEGDNVTYETAGYNLAHGDGLSLSYDIQPDPDVRSWACSRHPSWCEDGDVPTAAYPPGYQIYIASIYLVTGRSLVALVSTQLVLLLAMFWVFESTLAKYLGRPGYLFAMTVAATYPFLARQAGHVMSDHVHAALVTFALAIPLLLPAGWRRGLACGLLLGAATLTRPYCFVCIPFVAFALAWRATDTTWTEDVGGLMVGVFVPMAAWAIRNEIVFGRFIPFGTAGLGVSLYCNKLAWTIGSPYDAANIRAIYAELERAAGGSPYTWRANKALTAAAFEWMRANPWKTVSPLPVRVVREWISIGTAGEGVSRAWPLLVSYLGTLLVLGLAGIWTGRRRREIVLVALFIFPYWAFLLHAPAEARRTLALRLPMLLCAGVAVDGLIAGRLGRALRRWRVSMAPAETSAWGGPRRTREAPSAAAAERKP